MKKALSLALASLVLSTGCSLISPYTITFTNTPGSVVDPEFSTLDVVVSAPTLAYISGVSCEGAEPLELLPVVSKDMEVNTVHKLALNLMEGQPAGSDCEVTVTAYDKITTEQSSASIDVKMNGLALVQEGEMCGGIAAFQCAEGLTCEIADPTMPDASGTCVETATATVEETPVVDSTNSEDTSSSTETSAPEETPTDVPVEPSTTDVSAGAVETSVDTTTPPETTETPAAQ